jgi:MFS family permease
VEVSLCIGTGVFTGGLYDMGYFRSMLVSGCVLQVFGLMMLSLSTEYWQVLLSHGVCRGIGGGLLYVPSIALVASSFEDKMRPFALGIASSGAALGITQPSLPSGSC